MFVEGFRKSILLPRSRCADRVIRGHPGICSSGTSNRRFGVDAERRDHNGDGQHEVVRGCGEREGRSAASMRKIEAEYSACLND